MKKKSFTLDKEQIIQEFGRREPLFKELKTIAYNILDKKLRATKIKIHSIPSRIKEVNSFCDKVENYQLENPFETINDIVGLRVICLFLSDISKIGDVIRENFEVIREDNKVDDSKLASFGYLSVHFIVKLGDAYEKTVYSEIKDIPFEIQARTIAMDAWANISHYLDYKTDQDIPKELKKDFYALSGMFYVADKHFQLFFEQRKETQEVISETFEKGSETEAFSQPINLDTLSAYLKNKFPDRERNPQKVSELVDELLKTGYQNIGEIDELVENGLEALSRFEIENLPFPDSVKYNEVGVLRIIAYISNKKYQQIKAEEFANSNTSTSEEYWLEHFEKRYSPYRKYLKK